MTWRRAAAALLAGAVSTGCRPGPTPAFPKASVVLVSIDTLRADRLPLYGYAKGATPHLDALGREAIVFEDAYSHCPLTLPAHASLLTGLLPPHHGVRDNHGFRLASSVSGLRWVHLSSSTKSRGVTATWTERNSPLMRARPEKKVACEPIARSFSLRRNAAW